MSRGHWIPPVANPPSPPDVPRPPDCSAKVPRRMFVLECERPMHPHAVENLHQSWKRLTKGTEVEGSQVIVLEPGLKLVELTGEGLPKVTVDSEGKLLFLEDKPNG
jgi:hypothetical protein